VYQLMRKMQSHAQRGLQLAMATVLISVITAGAANAAGRTVAHSAAASRLSALAGQVHDPALTQLLRQHPGGRLNVVPMFLKGTAHGVAHADNQVCGNCGCAWIYDTPGTPNHIDEAIGLNLNYVILYGAGDVPWHNYSTGGGNDWQFTIGPSLSGNWNGAHSPSTGRGYVQSWLHASVNTIAGTCTSSPALWSVASAT
jgi:hypothetical protein